MVPQAARGVCARYCRELRPARQLGQIRRQFALLVRLIGKRKGLRVRLEKEVERIEYRHLGDQIHLDPQRSVRSGKLTRAR